MTRIIEVAGIPAVESAKSDAAGLKQRAANVRPLAPVDSVNLSRGEMALFLKAQRAKMLAEFYPEVPEYRRQFEAMQDILYKGLHRSAGLSYLPERLQTAPASGWLTWDEKQRQPSKGIQYLFDDTSKADYLAAIPQLNCVQLYPILSIEQFTAQGAPASVYQSYVQDQNAKRSKCATENQWRSSLNNYWDKCGHALIYEFLSPADFPGNLPDQAVEKKGAHRFFVERLSLASKISRDNIRLWQENGIIYKNIQGAFGKSLGPLSAVEFIEGLRDNANYTGTGQGGGTGVNGIPAILVNVALGVLKNTFNQFKILLDVLNGNTTVKQAIQQHIDNVEAFFQTYANDIAVMATTDDWKTDDGSGGGNGGNGGGGGGGNGGNGGGLSNEAKIGLGLAAAGLLWYTQSE